MTTTKGIAAAENNPAPEAHKTAGVLELKPCPFCGTDAFYEPRHEKGDFIAECWSCPAMVNAPTEAEAIEAWNTRSTPSVPAVAELSGGLALGVAGAAEGNLLTAAKKALAFYDGLDREHDPGEAAVLDALDTAVRAALTASLAGDDPKALDAEARSSSTEAVEQEVERLRYILFLFREFWFQNVTQTKIGSGHHHPMWQAVAEALGPMNRDGTTPEEWQFITGRDKPFPSRPSPVPAACKPEGETSFPGKEEGRG